jgi:hypothetical protein
MRIAFHTAVRAGPYMGEFGYHEPNTAAHPIPPTANPDFW